MVKKDPTGKNKCQVAVIKNLSKRYAQTNHKNKALDYSTPTFDVRHPNSDHTKGNNVLSININDHGYLKSFIVGVALAFLSQVYKEKGMMFTDAEIEGYKNKLMKQLSTIKLLHFINFSLLSKAEQDRILVKYSNTEKNG
jgi:hypothetical protein